MSFSWAAFWTYFQWSLEFLFAWPFLLVTLALIANLGRAFAKQRPFSRDRWKSEYWLVFASYLLIPAILAIAVIAAVNPETVPRPRPNTSAVWASDGLFIASLLLDAYWVYRMKGLRWFAVAVALIQSVDHVRRGIHFWNGTQRGLALVCSTSYRRIGLRHQNLIACR